MDDERPAAGDLTRVSDSDWQVAMCHLLGSLASAHLSAAVRDVALALKSLKPGEQRRLVDALLLEATSMRDENLLKARSRSGGKGNSTPDHVDIEIRALTEDQMAMLGLLRAGRVRQTIPLTVFVEPEETDIACGMEPHVATHHCPVVTWRGKERILMPDGSLTTLRRSAAND